jgi:hypothetical protein
VSLPSYGELPVSAGAPHWRSAWGVFESADSQLGTLNLLTAERRLAAAALVREGLTINLDHPMDVPLSIFAFRKRFSHNVFEIMPGYYDETVDELAPQLSSQWDAMRHVRSPDGFYSGLRTDEDAITAGGPLGIDHAGCCSTSSATRATAPSQSPPTSDANSRRGCSTRSPPHRAYRSARGTCCWFGSASTPWSAPSATGGRAAR